MSLEHSAEFESALLAATTEAVLVLDESGTVTYQGPAVAATFGFGDGELVGTAALDRVHAEDRDAVEAAFLELERASDDHQRVECRVLGPDEEPTWVELGVADETDGPVEGYVVSVRDVSERVAARRERADLLGRMTDAFLAVDESWRFTYVNSHAESLLGITAEEAVGTMLWTLFPELVDTTFEERYREAMATQESVTFEAFYEPLDCWFSVSAYPSDRGLSVFFQDVTDRVRTEQALAKNEKSLHDLHEVASDNDLAFEEKLVRLLDLGRERLGLELGFLTRIEDGVQRVVACRGDHEELANGESCPLDEAYCRETIETDGLLATRSPGEDGISDAAYDHFGLESYVGGKLLVDGELYGTLCFADRTPRQDPFRSDEQAFVEVLVEWMAYELERDRREQRLEEQNDRLETFASMVSHDLRNPLTVAQGHLEVARETGDEAALEEIARSHDRMERLIEDMLWLAREGEHVGSTEPVALDDVVREAWSFVATDGAELTVDESPSLEADRDRLLQLFENLFRNVAEHAVPEAGTGDGDAPTDSEPQVTVVLRQTADGFAIEDDGPGIPADERDTVFDAGFTTAAAGTGYGLAIVEQIAAAHGWTVDVEASDDGGARFAFRTA